MWKLVTLSLATSTSLTCSVAWTTPRLWMLLFMTTGFMPPWRLLATWSSTVSWSLASHMSRVNFLPSSQLFRFTGNPFSLGPIPRRVWRETAFITSLSGYCVLRVLYCRRISSSAPCRASWQRDRGLHASIATSSRFLMFLIWQKKYWREWQNRCCPNVSKPYCTHPLKQTHTHTLIHRLKMRAQQLIGWAFTRNLRKRPTMIQTHALHPIFANTCATLLIKKYFSIKPATHFPRLCPFGLPQRRTVLKQTSCLQPHWRAPLRPRFHSNFIQHLHTFTNLTLSVSISLNHSAILNSLSIRSLPN